MERVMHVSDGSIEYDKIQYFYKHNGHVMSSPDRYYAYIKEGHVIELTKAEYELERKRYESWKNHIENIEKELVREKRNHELILSENERKKAMWNTLNKYFYTISAGVLITVFGLLIEIYILK